jgi:maleate cis-trans isomerase
MPFKFCFLHRGDKKMKRLIATALLSIVAVSAHAARQGTDAEVDLSKYNKIGKVVRICDISDEESTKAVERKSSANTPDTTAKSGGSALKVASIRRVSECEIYVSKDTKQKDVGKLLSGEGQTEK